MPHDTAQTGRHYTTTRLLGWRQPHVTRHSASKQYTNLRPRSYSGNLPGLWGVRWRWGVVLLAGVLLLAGAGHAEEDTAAVSFSIGNDDDRVRIEVPSAADRYHVLYYRSDPDDAATENAVALHLGAEGSVTLSEPSRIGRTGAYRVATFERDTPGDIDGDGTDDLAELAREAKNKRAPFNWRAPFDVSLGAVALPDLATFQELSYLGNNFWLSEFDPHLSDLEHIKFIILDLAKSEPTQVFFINTNIHTRTHFGFLRQFFGEAEAFDLLQTEGSIRGEIVYHPYLRGPNGDVSVFRYDFQPGDSYSFEVVAQVHEALAANMPFLRNNLLYYPMPAAVARYETEKAKYDASRVPVLLAEDLYANSVFHAVNAGVGFGLLRVLGPGERPSFRDIVILRTLPNDLATFAGVISLVPQTPLSHVNLRAVQNGVPNAYIGNALEDDTISGLVGKYVRFEVKNPPDPDDWRNTDTNNKGLRATYTIREATAEEVEAHHADRRPTEAQTPSRDLTVTAYKDLDDIAFADSDAFGVKAANVAAMRDFGFTDGTVPDGYALPFYFYDEFMKHNGFYDDIDTLLADTDFQADIGEREDELKKLRRRIKNGAVPDWMTTKLGELHAEFAEGTSIRCRSSTNNEDLPGFSGAGLYDSYTHHPREGHLSKSIKQVFSSLWNLRAFEERDFHRIDHKAAAMGVLLHPNYSDEQVNGVAVSGDPFYGSEDRFYVNAQVGEELVTNPSAAALPEEWLLGTGEEFSTVLVQRSNLVADDARVLSDAHIATLQAALRTIHARFHTLYDIAEDAEFAMEIEFKVTAADAFAVKQARPWVY